MLVVLSQMAFAKPSINNTAKSKFHRKHDASLIHIGFGFQNEIIYDLNSGKSNVYYGKVLTFRDAIAAIKYESKRLTSENYDHRKYSQEAFSNALGRGTKHIVTLTSYNRPQLKQIFYTLPGKSYFFTELELSGHQIQSNYMAPWICHFVPLSGKPKSVIVPFDNDTFISYDARSFETKAITESAEVGLVFDNASRKGIIAGSIEQSNWKTGVMLKASSRTQHEMEVWAGYTDQRLTRDSIPHGLLKGDLISSPKIMIGLFNDWRNGMENYSLASRSADPPHIKNWTEPTPVGWNSWGVIQEHLSYEKAIKVTDYIADSVQSFRTGGTAYIDLDSYWDKMIQGNDFSLLKKFADHCKSKGLQPGVYWAPFTDWGYKNGPDRKIQSSNYTYGDAWTKVGKGFHNIDGARAMDPTHPGTLQRIDHFTNIFKACGFKMIKIDFLGHGAIESTHFYDTRVTTGMQAYRYGMEYLTDRLKGMFIYAAISPSMATGRYVHSRRIACDAFKTIEHTEYTLNSLTYGWWQTYLYNFVDADHVVFNHQSEGENRARLLSSIITGTLIAGDDLSLPGTWSAQSKKWFQDAELLTVVMNGKAFSPVEASTGKNAAVIFSRKIGRALYLALFNYHKKGTFISFDPGRLGLSSTASYRASELFSGTSTKLTGPAKIALKGKDAALYKIELP